MSEQPQATFTLTTVIHNKTFCNLLAIVLITGCYPNCPAAQPYFNEETMKCVEREQCGCYDYEGNQYTNGQNLPAQNCETWYV